MIMMTRRLLANPDHDFMSLKPEELPQDMLVGGIGVVCGGAAHVVENETGWIQVLHGNESQSSI